MTEDQVERIAVALEKIAQLMENSQKREVNIAKKQIKEMVGDNEREVYCDHLTAKRDKRGAIRITRRRI